MKVHYYAVVHGGLPEETAEQLKWLVRNNSNGLSWDELERSELLASALEMARHARTRLLDRLVEVVGGTETGDRFSTEFNLLRRTNFRGGSGAISKEVVYYDLCTSSEQCAHGVLTMVSPGQAGDGIVWLHGAPSRSMIGGGPWTHSETADAVPMFRYGEFANAITHLERFGYHNSWGKAFLKPIVVCS